jgi:hypothetical protein
MPPKWFGPADFSVRLGPTLIRLMDLDSVKSKPVVEPAAQLDIGATFTLKAPGERTRHTVTLMRVILLRANCHGP